MDISQKEALAALFSLEGRAALVTGGGGVLGRAIGKGLGLAGAKVAIADIIEEKAQEAAGELSALGIDAIGVAFDALNTDAIAKGLDEVEKRLGSVDILVNGAGGNIKSATVSEETDFFHLPGEALNKVIGLNLLAGVICPTQVIGERMVKRNRGSIINVSSMNAFRPLTRIVGYSAAKAAVSNATQWLAVYMARDLKSAVRVNAIAPGFFLTEQNRYLLLDEQENLTARGATIIDHTPMGRFGAPDDLIGACVWLASDASAFVSGIVLPIDGGFSAFSGV